MVRGKIKRRRGFCQGKKRGGFGKNVSQFGIDPRPFPVKIPHRFKESPSTNI
jgi:hypothetical protein